MEDRALKRVNGECSRAGLEHAGENAIGYCKAAGYRTGAADEAAQRKRVRSRRRHRRGNGSEASVIYRARVLDHNDVLVRVDDEHHLAFARWPMRDAEVTSRDRGIRAERAEAVGLEWLSIQGERDAVFSCGADDCLTRCQLQRE